MTVFTAWLAGLVFGLGLLVSGLADPAKVLGFLDLAGAWDPSLALVMAGAVAIGSIGFAVARRRGATLSGGALHIPTARRIDRRLVAGSTLFGIGWGVAGFCPGPAIVAAGAGEPRAVAFVLAMLTGFALYELIEGRRTRVQPAAS